jgi:hypothetical protein
MTSLGPVGKGIIFLAGLAVVAFGFYWYEDEIKGYPPPWQQACTMEAMQCPDGSYVGRSGPNCEFVCPTATTTPPVSGGGGDGFAEYHSGVKGTVVAGPTCPVERNPPDPACADKPIQTNVWISRKVAPEQVIATTYSDKLGVFQLSLPPGDYVIQAGSSGVPYPRCTDTSATVGSTGYTNIVINCDTGIR